MNIRPKFLLLGVVSVLPVQAELIHHYTFDGVTTDSGSGALDLTLGAAASIDTSCFRVGSGALRLQSSNAAETRPASVPAGVPPAGNVDNGFDGAYTTANFDPTALPNGDALTVTAWILPDRLDPGDGNPDIVCFGDTTGNGTRASFRLHDNNFFFVPRHEIQGGNTRVDPPQIQAKIADFTTLNDGRWWHIAWVIPNADSLQEDTLIYINGVEFSGADMVGTFGQALMAAAGPIHIGDGINGTDRDFNGFIDDVRIYDEALDGTAIQALVDGAAGQGSLTCDFSVDQTSIVAGEPVTFSWNTFGVDSLSIDNGIGDMLPSTDATTGVGSATVFPTVSGTYTLTAGKGGTTETRTVEIAVQDFPELAAVATPPFSNGSVPAQICWKATSEPIERLSSTIGSLTGGGTVVSDPGVDFNGIANFGGPLTFTLDTPYFTDNTAIVSSIDSGTQLTLATAVGTSLSANIQTINTTFPGSERCYEAYGPDPNTIGLDNTRWPNCVDPANFLGSNGAAEFEDATGTGVGATPVSRTPIAVADAQVPGITAAYEFGDAIGKARIWYGDPPPHDIFSQGNATLEMWLKPNSLTGGQQILTEFGGNQRGSYMALVDDTVYAYARGNTVPGATVSHQLSDTNWVHVVAVFHNTADGLANDYLELIVNGVVVSTSPMQNIQDFAGTDDGGLGGVEQTYAIDGPVTEAAAGLHFEGLIARFALFGRALSLGEAQNNYLAITQDTAAAQSFAAGAGYTLSEAIGATSITIDDDDPATTPSPLFTTNEFAELGEGCFTTAANVTQTTTYTVTATGFGSNTSVDTTLTVGGAGTTFPELVQQAGPLAWYRFNEPADSPGLLDSSGNNHHSTIFTGNQTLGQTGAVDGAMDLVAGAREIELNLDFNPQDPDGDDTGLDEDPDDIEGFTIEGVFLVDVSANNAFKAIASNRDSALGTGRTNWEFTANGRNRSFMGNFAKESATPQLDDSWCHYAMTCEYDPDFFDYTVTFYVDGALDESFQAVLVEPSNGRWLLGTAKALVSPFDGVFDDIVFYDRVLGEAEIQSHAAAVNANSQIPLMAFGVKPGTPDFIGEGETAELFYKIGGGATGDIDNGAGSGLSGSGTVTVSPAQTTGYTLSVGADTRTATVNVLGPITITDLGIDANGFFFMTVANLNPNVVYELRYSETLDDDFVNFTGSVANGAGNAGVTFTDTLPAANAAKQFYRVVDVTNP